MPYRQRPTSAAPDQSLGCPRCGLIITPRFQPLMLWHCPRCIARSRSLVRMLAGRRATEMFHFQPGARGGARLGRYEEPSTGRSREIVILPAAGASTLLVDRLTDTHADSRLIAHIAYDEPCCNARILTAMYLAEATKARCRPVCADDLQPAAPTGLAAKRTRPDRTHHLVNAPALAALDKRPGGTVSSKRLRSVSNPRAATLDPAVRAEGG